MAITSVVRNANTALAFGEASLTDWQAAGLLKPSVLKPVFTTIEQRLIIKQLGTLSTADANALREVLRWVVG
jgi:mRNA interferase MazF